MRLRDTKHGIVQELSTKQLGRCITFHGFVIQSRVRNQWRILPQADTSPRNAVLMYIRLPNHVVQVKHAETPPSRIAISKWPQVTYHLDGNEEGKDEKSV